MFREMRRFKQQLSVERSKEVLSSNTAGVLSVLGDDGYPYGVPLSYAYDNGKIYLHCGPSGHKIDAIKSCDKVSFCVIDEDTVVEKEYTTYFRSVIAFGRIHIASSPEEIKKGLTVLTRKYSASLQEQEILAHIDSGINRTTVLVIEIQHLTGKEAIEFVNAKKENS